MHPIINDLLQHKEKIRAIYLIGSSKTENYQSDSDIDIVVFVNDIINGKIVQFIRNEYRNVDLIVLDFNRIALEIAKSPSIYISAINQILLNPRLLYGEDCIHAFKLSKKKVLYNQLHFPYYMLIKLKLTHLIGSEKSPIKSLLKTTLGQQFNHEGLPFYSYRLLKTLMLTLCSYKLIRYNKFDRTKPGKHWFIEDYLNLCRVDKDYKFIKQFDAFVTQYKTSVFDAPVLYFENKSFKKNLLNILAEYSEYFQSIDETSFSNNPKIKKNVKKEKKTITSQER